jgi:hypothetical protein
LPHHYATVVLLLLLLLLQVAISLAAYALVGLFGFIDSLDY